MPCHARIDTPGTAQHVIVHGIERCCNIFPYDEDRYNWIGRIDTSLERPSTPGFAVALVPNHIYLLLHIGRKAFAKVTRIAMKGATK